MQGDVLVQLIGEGGAGGGGAGGEEEYGGGLAWVGKGVRRSEKKPTKGRKRKASILSRCRNFWGKTWAKKPGGGALPPAASAAADCPPCPPPFFILAVSIVEISLYLWVGASDASVEGVTLSGFPPPAPSLSPHTSPPSPTPTPASHHSQLRRLLLYDPHRRWEAWRFATYMLLHTGALHLALNVAIQAMLATPLEAEQGHLRTGLVYFGGGLGGSLSTSMLEPEIYIVGASGGVYALLISQLANVLLNFRRLRYKAYRAVAVAFISLADIAFSVYHFVRRGNECPRIGWAAHTGGAIAGFLLGMVLFRSDEEEWEVVLPGREAEAGGRRTRRSFYVQTAVRWLSYFLLSAFVTASVITNVTHPETTHPITNFSSFHNPD